MPQRTTCSAFGPTSLPITLKRLPVWKERFSMPATGWLRDQTWATSDVTSRTNPFVFVRCGGHITSFTMPRPTLSKSSASYTGLATLRRNWAGSLADWILQPHPWLEITPVAQSRQVRGLHKGETEALRLALGVLALVA